MTSLDSSPRLSASTLSLALVLALSGAMLLPGCGDGTTDSDAGGGGTDAGPVTEVDAGGEPDAGPDAGADIDGGGVLCELRPTCDTTAPDPGTEPGSWNHRVSSTIAARTGLAGANHRGRDLILREGDPQWALAKFAYGSFDDDLKDENVDVWVLRDCGSEWEFLGTALTTDDGDHETIEGVEDTGGRVFMQIPSERPLAIGRHRVHFIVQGDHTTADQIIEVVPANVPYVVSDVDGTLTDSETAAFRDLFNDAEPASQPSAAEALTALAERGYLIFYITARPEWFHPRTHAWLRLRGFPDGIVHTTLGLTGEFGNAAIAFKTGELEGITARMGQPPIFTIGNTDTDAAAFAAIGTSAENRYLYRLDGDAAGGVHFDDYATLESRFSDIEPICRF